MRGIHGQLMVRKAIGQLISSVDCCRLVAVFWSMLGERPLATLLAHRLLGMDA